MLDLALVIPMAYVVKQYMSQEVPTITEGASVTEAAKVMDETADHKGFLVVLKDMRPVGIVTEHDFAKKVLAQELDPAKVTVGEIMSSPLITVDPDEDLLKAAELMKNNDIERLPVVKDGIIYGVLTARLIALSCSEYVNRSVKDIVKWSGRAFF
jgi:CBS domain-containing protein